MAASRRFGQDDFVVQDEDGDARLVAFGENAVYGVALAFPEVDDDPYRVDLIRTTREASGIERAQRLTLHEYDSHMEAEEGLRDISDALFEGGREAIAAHLPGLATQPAEYTAGLMVTSYPPDAVFTGAEASVSLIAVTDTGIQDAMVGWNLPPHDASHLSMALEEAQAAGGPSLLLETAMQEAQARGQLEVGQPLLKPGHTVYLDQRDMLERDAEIAQPDDWGWHAARFAVLLDGDAHQVALLDVYHDAITGDLGGSYLPLGEHASLADAEQQRDALEAAAFDAEEDSSGWPKFAAQQVDDPQWQSMQPQHYVLYERLSGRVIEDDLPAEIDPLLAEAIRLGAVVTEVDMEEEVMSNTLKAERVGWQVDLNEHVTHLPPHVTAEYRSPENAEGVAPVRLRPQGDASMYGFEVSAPDEAGRVTLAATKTFESEILLKDVTETAVLKTYLAGDYDEATSYLDPRTDALSDARTLVYEWRRADLDHGMGSALKLAQDNGFKGERLFTEGPPDTFTPAEDARPVDAIQAERDWERDAEIFGSNGYKVPLPEDIIHAREVGRYGADTDVPPGQFYAVTVREAALDEEAEHVFVVEGLKAWLDRESGETQRDVVALGIEVDRDNATAMENTFAEADTVPERLERMAALANDFAGKNDPHIEQLGLTIREQGLFTEGPPDPQHPIIDDDIKLFDVPEIDPPGRLATPIGAYVDRHAGDYAPADASVLPTGEHPASTDEIQYQSLPLDTLTTEPHEKYVPAEYDPVRMKPIDDGIPADHAADYAFEVSHIRAFDMQGELGDSYHLVEVVKTWHDPDLLPDEPDTRLTLSLPLAAYDDKEAAFETAHQLTAIWWAEGIQPAMQDAANMAQGHINPNVLDVENGHLFGMGPPDPFTVNFQSQEREVSAQAPPASNLAVQAYSRSVGEAAYDLPLEDGQAYEFRARPVPELQTEVAGFGADAFAVETVKHWQDNGEPQQEVVTLGLVYDQAEARRDVDTYVDLAEREGIQAAMSCAAAEADIQNYPIMLERAAELNLHPNEGIRYGDLFQHGPDDPFLSERDILYATQQYAADHPPHHRLSLEIVPVQDTAGQALGHSVLALDAAWDHDETSRELDDAQSVAAYEVAQFETQEGADLYRQSLSEYMDKRDLEPEGAEISGAVDFVKTVGESNGHGERWLAPWDIAQLAKGEWALQHDTDDFHPMTVETISAEVVAEVSIPDMEF